jgi:hypothetical protein
MEDDDRWAVGVLLSLFVMFFGFGLFGARGFLVGFLLLAVVVVRALTGRRKPSG